jgi:hypothetical protein
LKGGAANDKGEVTLSQLVKYVQEAVPKRIAIDLGSTKQQKPFAVIEGYRADELVLAVTNAASNTTSNMPGNIATVDPAAIELSFWETIKNSNNPEDFKSIWQNILMDNLRTREIAPTASRPRAGRRWRLSRDALLECHQGQPESFGLQGLRDEISRRIVCRVSEQPDRLARG